MQVLIWRDENGYTGAVELTDANLRACVRHLIAAGGLATALDPDTASVIDLMCLIPTADRGRHAAVVREFIIPAVRWPDRNPFE